MLHHLAGDLFGGFAVVVCYHAEANRLTIALFPARPATEGSLPNRDLGFAIAAPAAEWLRSKAIEIYPDSEFAKQWQRGFE
jgi:hypothetical protein